jgi:hypothetical protein
MDSSRFHIIRAVNQPFQSGMNQSPGTHRARLNRNKQLAALQAVVADGSARFTKRNYFGMSGRIRLFEVPVASPPNNVGAANHHRAHWNLSRFERASSLAQSLLHEKFVGVISGVRRKRISRGRIQGWSLCDRHPN